ncbi:MAG: SDR family oxidoreductase [Spirochaetales bacterium]|nr:SDR family oxidoreductase [Spirochaetales bacterium]
MGYVTAELLLNLGARVMLHGRDHERLKEAYSRLATHFGEDRLGFAAGDLTSKESAAKVADAAWQRFGRLDVLINNAGTSMRGRFGELSYEVIDRLLRDNLLGSLLITRACWKLVSEGGGRVWFVSTLGAVRGFAGVSVYGAAKAALTSISESLTVESHPAGLKSGVVYLPFVENDPGKTILNAQGALVHHERHADWSQARAAEQILRSVAKGKPKDYSTLSGRLLALAECLIPSVLTTFFRRKNLHQITVVPKPVSE